MKQRFILTVLWLSSFLIAVLILLSYPYARDSEGYRLLLPGQVNGCLKPVAVLYGSYLAGILGFWFLRPLPPAASDSVERLRFQVALACTVIFNAIVLFIIAQTYFGLRTTFIADNVSAGIEVAELLSWLVAPVNVFYFATKMSSTS